MKVVATICSSRKDANPELLPAKERYLGDHIQLAQTEAERQNLPLYILSGKFGLISGDDFISNYDYLLEKETEELIRLVRSQMEEIGITEIELYYKDSKSWNTYISTLTKAARLADVKLCLQEL